MWPFPQIMSSVLALFILIMMQSLFVLPKLLLSPYVYHSPSLQLVW